MATTWSKYYNLVRTRESSPEAMDWAATDKNVEVMSTLMKAFEQHAHTGNSGIDMPNAHDHLTFTPINSGGVLAPGTIVGVRLSFSNAMGLETTASVEKDYQFAAAVDRPLSPHSYTIDTLTTGLSGGVYTYVMTKTAGGGETAPSDALAVDIPYDQAYSVMLTFDSIDSLHDGTQGYNIYRSAGLNSMFQLVGQITTDTDTTFVDNNVSIDQTIQPPSSSTFDQTKQLLIQWVDMEYPSDATSLNIYVTQQPGVWSTDHLLASIDLTGMEILDYLYYQGSETLASGTPYENTQIPSAPPKINLGAETTGGFLLTTDGDFVGHQAKHMVLHTTTSPTTTDGTIYYDPSIPTARARINGAWVNWGTSTESAYAHPDEEDGGHLATKIRWKTGEASPSVGSLLAGLYDVDGNPIQYSVITKAVGDSANPTKDDTDSGFAVIDDMTVSITPLFDNQWVEITFQGAFGNKHTGSGTASFIINLDGSEIGETRKFLKLAQNEYGSISIVYHVQLGTGAHTVEACWNVVSKPMKIVSLGKNRSLVAKTLV